MNNFRKGLAIFIISYMSVLLNCQNAIQPNNDQFPPGPWVEFKNGSIRLYCRPIGYSTQLSPDSSAAFSILKEQHYYVNMINDSLYTAFNRPFDIYLFNLDESNSGTTNGIDKIYFLYLPSDSFKTIDTIRYIGCHELAHLIAGIEIGHPPTFLMNEGYATALDGFYGFYKDSTNFYVPYPIKLRNCRTGSFLSIDQLLDAPFNFDLYPQIGCFIQYLFNRFETRTVNKLYTLDAANIRSRFYSITGCRWDSLGLDYLKYLDSICQGLK
jgi:hypothetical protein